MEDAENVHEGLAWLFRARGHCFFGDDWKAYRLLTSLYLQLRRIAKEQGAWEDYLGASEVRSAPPIARLRRNKGGRTSAMGRGRGG